MIPLSMPVGPAWSRIYFWDFSLFMIFFCWIARLSRERGPSPKLYALDALLITFLLWLLFCNMLGLRIDRSFEAWLLWIRGFLIYLYFSRNLGKVIKVNDILIIFFLLVLFENSLCIYQVLTQSNFGQINQYVGSFNPDKIPGFWYKGQKYIRAPGTFFNTGLVAGWMVMLLPVFLSFYFFSYNRRLKNILIVTWNIGIIGAVCTLTRTPILSIIFGSIIVLCWRRSIRLTLKINKNFLIFATIFLLFTVSIIVISYSSGSLEKANSRVSAYKKSLEKRVAYVASARQIMFMKPLFGVGQGNFGLLLDETGFPFYHHGEGVVHNIPLLIGTESGYIGFFLFLSLLILLIVKTIRRTSKFPSTDFHIIKGGALIGIVSFICNMQFSASLIHHSVLPLFFVMIGLSSSRKYNQLL